jgi:hypothetical protein
VDKDSKMALIGIGFCGIKSEIEVGYAGMVDKTAFERMGMGWFYFPPVLAFS